MGRESESAKREEDQTDYFEQVRDITHEFWEDKLTPVLVANQIPIGIAFVGVLYWIFGTPLGDWQNFSRVMIKTWEDSTSGFPIVQNNPVFLILGVGLLLAHVRSQGDGNYWKGGYVVLTSEIIPGSQAILKRLGQLAIWAGRRFSSILSSAWNRFVGGLRARCRNGWNWVDTTIIDVFPTISIPEIVALMAGGGISLGVILERFQWLPLRPEWFPLPLDWLPAIPFP